MPKEGLCFITHITKWIEVQPSCLNPDMKDTAFVKNWGLEAESVGPSLYFLSEVIKERTVAE